MGADLLDLAPVPGLRATAVTLLNVWDALQKVDRLCPFGKDFLSAPQRRWHRVRIACLRLTQRCVDILICVRQKVQDAGGDVGDELISGCDASLSDGVSAFSLSIQIRILKQVQTLNSPMISNSNFTALGVQPPPVYTQAIPEESGIATPTRPNPQTLLPTPTRSAHGYMLFARKRTNAMQGLISLICVS
ncbi:hypothetical protein PILCRDRAFT_191930 [Piloderma croceum F 1598]|uniref:Uncharacterized protein n=1 Tax=Piloderma croceum (strain F 1598) TaxID=765440 RepID=A0A0C3BSZ7_PILCF|nr:hypothetical protein PILCRDRAFT_191930 [Piloderma croceum F 1598]